ncbi:MAG: GTP cyclohydrolase [Euryarchaeota archaeon]|nr:GTP cyclohydrolase [Euryarchaeota archaeon]
MTARYFYRDCLESNWYMFKFRYKGLLFRTAEHALMHEKAVLMGDSRAAAKILKAQRPLQAKKLGRKVEPFDQALWDAHCDKIMEDILVAKFTFSQRMREYLLGERGPFYEASPKDKIWGIGISVEEAEAGAPHNGENKLGKALDRARARLLTIVAREEQVMQAIGVLEPEAPQA